MTIQIHTFRRGAIYTWRKRLPAKLGGGVLQLSLRTADPLIGRRIAAILGGESCGVIDAMVHQGLSKEDARRLLGRDRPRTSEDPEYSPRFGRSRA